MAVAAGAVATVGSLYLQYKGYKEQQAAADTQKEEIRTRKRLADVQSRRSARKALTAARAQRAQLQANIQQSGAGAGSSAVGGIGSFESQAYGAQAFASNVNSFNQAIFDLQHQQAQYLADANRHQAQAQVAQAIGKGSVKVGQSFSSSTGQN